MRDPLTPKVGWQCYWALLPGFLLSNLEGSLVNLVLPMLAQDLRIEVGLLGWVPMACQLPTTALILAFGALADGLGRRRMYLAGLTLVGVGTVVAALAPSFPVLLVARVLQGIGCAGVAANGLAIVAEQFEPHEQGRAVGGLTALVGVGAIVSPPLAGALAGALGWRMVFWLQVPVVLAGLWGMMRRVPADAPVAQGAFARVPWGHAALMSTAVAGVVTGIWGGGQWGWGATSTLVLLLLGLSAFVGWRWLESRSANPLLPVGELKAVRPLLAGLGSTNAVMAGVSFLFPLLLARHLQVEGLALGLQLLPLPLGAVLGSLLGGRLKDRRGILELPWLPGVLPLLLAGAVVLVGMTLGQGFTGQTALFSPLRVGASFGVGLAMGCFAVFNNARLLELSTGQRTGTLTGLMGLLRQLGGVMGVAWAGGLLTQSDVMLVVWGGTAFPAILAGVWLLGAGMGGQGPGRTKGSEVQANGAAEAHQ